MNTPSESLKEQKIQAEIDKLNAEKDKIIKETNNVDIVAVFSVIANLVVIVVGIIAGYNLFSLQKEVITVYKDQIKDLKKQKEEISKINEALKKERKIIEQQNNEILTNFRDKVISKEEEKVKAVVFIQFRGSLTRSLMNQLAQSFQAQNYNSPGVERLAGSYQNMVRYFHSSDKQLAENISKIAQDFFKDKNCPVKNITLDERKQSEFPNVPQKQLELWIHHSCSTADLWELYKNEVEE